MILSVCFIANELMTQPRISKYELCWAVFHPFVALKVKNLLSEAMISYEEVRLTRVLDTNESGGKLDAFRHVFTMSFLSQKFKVRKLKKLGIAHEKGNKHLFYKNRQEFGERSDSLSCVMDLRNNDLGFVIGSSNQAVAKDSLIIIVINLIKEGNAWYLKRNAKNEYVSCENELIMMEKYQKKWFVPKCLIKTNE
ncbi:MAG: hypothetical protein V4565_04330 [Bacteroidota bacterium]